MTCRTQRANAPPDVDDGRGCGGGSGSSSGLSATSSSASSTTASSASSTVAPSAAFAAFLFRGLAEGSLASSVRLCESARSNHALILSLPRNCSSSTMIVPRKTRPLCAPQRSTPEVC